MIKIFAQIKRRCLSRPLNAAREQERGESLDIPAVRFQRAWRKAALDRKMITKRPQVVATGDHRLRTAHSRPFSLRDLIHQTANPASSTAATISSIRLYFSNVA